MQRLGLAARPNLQQTQHLNAVAQTVWQQCGVCYALQLRLHKQCPGCPRKPRQSVQPLALTTEEFAAGYRALRERRIHISHELINHAIINRSFDD